MIKKIVPWLGVLVTLLLLAALMAPRMTGQSSTPQAIHRTQFAQIGQIDFVFAQPREIIELLAGA